jgi:hypothetical protein
MTAETFLQQWQLANSCSAICNNRPGVQYRVRWAKHLARKLKCDASFGHNMVGIGMCLRGHYDGFMKPGTMHFSTILSASSHQIDDHFRLEYVIFELDSKLVVDA